MASEPTEAEIIKAAIESALLDVHTCMPARVESYTGATQTVDVLPVIKRAVPRDDGSVANEELKVIHNVPICYPRGGGYAIQWPLVKGDHVLLVFSEVATAIWRTTGQISEPGFPGRHDLSYAFAIPGIGPTTQPLTPPVGDEMVVDIATMLRLGSLLGSKFVALAEKVDANFSAIKDMFTNWAPVAMDGGAALKTLSADLEFDSTAASKVKAE